MWELAERGLLNKCAHGPCSAGTAVFEICLINSHAGPRTTSVVYRDHLFAILIYQGSDPTQPYPTLVIRQSATLPYGFSPRGHSTLFGPLPRWRLCEIRFP